jgi:predicted glycosyltransferase involved in capsule biosynthesis
MNISFIIAVYIDSEDRISNLNHSILKLYTDFPNSEIIISELDKESKIKNIPENCKHIFTKTEEFFNKQKAYNIGLKHSNKDNICLYDADIILKRNIVDKCYNLLQDNKIDIIYPYNGYFYDVPKHLHNNLNIETLSINDCKLLSDRSVGGVVFFKKNIFIEGGCGNQNFIGAGYEDNELYERYKKLGYSIGRLNAPLFHLTHQRKETSFDYNPYDSHNKKEFFRICNMTKEELLKEIKTWNYAT